MAESQDAILLQRRARRRLVGAIALVVLTVIVLPVVFDQEPRSVSQDLLIDIPGQSTGRFNSRLLQTPGERGEPARRAAAPASTASMQSTETPAAAVKAPTAATVPAAAAKAAPVPAVSPVSAAPAARSATARAETAGADAEAQRAKAALEGEQFVVPLGAYTSRENVKQLQAKVSAAGFKAFTEKAPRGDQLRVRAGPFRTRETAEQARAKLKSQGLPTGAVARQ